MSPLNKGSWSGRLEADVTEQTGARQLEEQVQDQLGKSATRRSFLGRAAAIAAGVAMTEALAFEPHHLEASDPVAIGNPFKVFPDRGWEKAYRDIFQSDFDRQLYRITLVGQKLVGVDGRESQAIEGLPILSAAEELKMRPRTPARSMASRMLARPPTFSAFGKQFGAYVVKYSLPKESDHRQDLLRTDVHIDPTIIPLDAAVFQRRLKQEES